MAATQADLSRLDAILKDRPIMSAIQDAINTATPFLERINQTLSLSGRKGIFPVSFGVNEGVYARADKGTFGDSQVDQPDLAEVTAKFIYALFEISGPTMSATRDTPGAFEEALSLSLENTITGLRLDLARQVIGDGSGKIALVQSITDTDTGVYDSPFGLTHYKSNRPVKNLIRANMPLDNLDASTPTTKHGDNQSVSTVTHSSTGTTLDYSAVDASLTSAADGDFLVRAGNYNLEIEGWFAAISTTTSGNYLNIPRSGNLGWQGTTVDAADGGSAAVPLSPDHLRDTVDLIMEQTGEAPGFITCNFKQRRNVYNLFAPQIRRAPMVLPAGLREGTLEFDDMPVVVERFFPPETIGFVNPRFWAHAIDKDTEWIAGLNGTVLHFHRTSDVFTAVLRTYRNLVCRYPATNGFIYGLEE
jgi:hypothetical protein